MVWLINNDLDYETSNKIPINDRFIFLEICTILEASNAYTKDERNEYLEDSVEKASQLPSPRFIKTHLPAELLPIQLWTVKPKIVYVARNPKDVAVSMYHHFRNVYGYTATFDQHMDLFMSDQVMWAPFHNHVLNFWHIRNEENILFLTYEEMKMNLMPVLQKMLMFFGKEYPDAEIEKLHSSLSV